MRVADKVAFDQVNSNIAKNRSEMAQLQNQAATQKRVTKPSDDPVAASRVLFGRTEQRGNEQFIKNLNYARGFLEFTEQSLSELSEVLVRAKELAISQASDGSTNEQAKRAVAAEIRQLNDQLIRIGNRKLGERFIFGGFKTTETPFDEDGNYKGDSGEMKIHVDKASFLPMNLPGSAVFLGEGISRDGVMIESEKQPTKFDELQAIRAKQDPQPEKGADGGAIKAGSENSNNPNGEVIQRGPASLRTPPSVTDTDGQPSVADARASQNGVNLFRAVENLEISLRANDKAGVQESIDALDEALQQVILARTTLGSRVNVIDHALNSLHSIGVDTKMNISQLEDADAFEVISNINKTESSLQATLSTSGKLIQKSLLDFL